MNCSDPHAAAEKCTAALSPQAQACAEAGGRDSCPETAGLADPEKRFRGLVPWKALRKPLTSVARLARQAVFLAAPGTQEGCRKGRDGRGQTKPGRLGPGDAAVALSPLTSTFLFVKLWRPM